jgi:phage-related protein
MNSRIQDQDKSWRIVYRIDRDAVVILEVFRKTTQQTPQRVIQECKRRLKLYEATKSSRD